jgi:hypothetical protein
MQRGAPPSFSMVRTFFVFGLEMFIALRIVLAIFGR